MGTNRKWNNYTNEELINMLRKEINNNIYLKAKDFSKLGLPTIDTYRKILNLKSGKMEELLIILGYEYKKEKGYTYNDIVKMASDSGFELLNETYKTSKDIATLRCKECGDIKQVKFQAIINGTRCIKCTQNPKRLTFAQIKEYVEVESKSGCNLNETEESYLKKCKDQPKMALCKLSFICKCGNKFETSFNSFKSANKRSCNECSYEIRNKNISFSYDEVKNYIENESNSGCKLLSETYEGYHKPLLIECSCGNSFNRALSEFKGRKLFKCQECTGAVIPYTYNQVKEDLLKYGIELLENEYKNNSIDMLIKYPCGFECKRNYVNIKKSQYKCPHCVRNGYGRSTERLKEEIHDITNGEYELLSEYKTMNDKVTILHHKCNTTYEVTPHNFIDGGTRCVKCGSSKGETRIEKYLKENKYRYIPQYAYLDLLSDKGFELRFDFAILNNDNEVELLIEYDGEFHYKKIYAEHDFEGQIKRDSQKNKYCKDNNIDLLRIPYWDFENIEKILENKLKEEY